MHLYLHVPFCARRCSYCDFAIAVRREVPSRAYTEAILSEWRGWLGHPAWRDSPVVDTVYFGGGTPSRLDPASIALLLERIRADRGLAPGAEVTLEVNPDDVTGGAARAWRDAGVNRASLGAQSFDPAVLAWMHRTHTAAQVEAAVGSLREAGIGEISLDLIFALPGALSRDWGADLDRALGLHPAHLSLYGLTVEAHTPLARWVARRDAVEAPDERYAEEFLLAHERLGAAGYEHYEVSNYALPGKRARHNSAYWRRAPYVGLGPSAHSGFGRERRWNVREWAEYERRIGAGETVVGGSESLDDDALRLEELYLGLRTVDGVSGDRIDPVTQRRWCDAGWATVSEGRVRLTAEGWLRLDALVGGGAEGRRGGGTERRRDGEVEGRRGGVAFRCARMRLWDYQGSGSEAYPPSMQPYEKLDAWRTAHRLALAVYQATAAWPVAERYGLTAQLRRAVVSVPANIVEGRARSGTREFKRFLDIAWASLAEVEYELRLARDLGYLADDAFAGLGGLRDAVARPLFGLICSLRGTEGRRDGGAERRRDGGTEGRRDGEVD